MKKQAAGSEKAFFSKSRTSCNIQAKSFFLQNIEKNSVEIQQFPVYGMQDWSTLCSSMFGLQTKT